MSAEALLVEKRETTGTLRIRRLRKEGKVPAILYGHGKENVNLVIDSRAVAKVVDHGSYIVSLSGAVTETAMIKEVQWDAFGSRILHLDLARIDASESVEAALPLQMKGEAPGANLGGMVTQLTHELKITCPANTLPDYLEVSIENLELDGSVSANEVVLPEGAALVGNPLETIITCPPPKGATVDAGDDEDAPTEPEVIGDKGEDEGKEEASE